MAIEKIPTQEQGQDMFEFLKSSLKPLFKDMFERWDLPDEERNHFFQHERPVLEFMATMDYAKRSMNVDPARFGEYTVNSDSVYLDYDSIDPDRIKVVDLGEFSGRPHYEVLEHVKNTYSKEYYFPGLEFMRHLFKSAEIPHLRDSGARLVFPGSLMRNSRGYWSILDMSWDPLHLRFDRSTTPLKNEWNGGEQVILIQR